MSKESALAKRTAIYAVGNFGSKIMAYVMVLVYSYFISAEEMGYYDIVLTTISMVQPLVLFQINDAVYRFLVDAAHGTHGKIIGNGFRFLCLTTLIAEVGLFVLNAFVDVQYVVWIALLLASAMIFMYWQDVVRGLGASKMYAGVGILNGVSMLAFEVIGLVVFKMGVVALLLSKILANGVCIVWMMLRMKEIRNSLNQKMNKATIMPLLRYSAPLVPNSISWWAVNFSNRYIILFFLGAAFNGIFAMANKFPTILTTITSIFYLAWQESAIKEYNTPNRDRFFSDIFHKYYVLLFTLCLCAVPATRFVIEMFVSPEYKNAWLYTGLLYLGAAYSALASFLGMGYQISKETARSFSTTVFAALLSILVNVVLIQKIGLYAASIATFASYLFLFIIRIKHTSKYFTLTINWSKFVLLTAIVFVMIVVTTWVPSVIFTIPLCIISIIVLCRTNKALFLPIIDRVFKKRLVR